MNSMKIVIQLHSLHWSIRTKDGSKCGTAFGFIFGVNWLWRCGVTTSFGVSFNEIECNGMTIFMEFSTSVLLGMRRRKAVTKSKLCNFSKVFLFSSHCFLPRQWQKIPIVLFRRSFDIWLVRLSVDHFVKTKLVQWSTKCRKIFFNSLHCKVTFWYSKLKEYCIRMSIRPS